MVIRRLIGKLYGVVRTWESNTKGGEYEFLHLGCGP